jgi:hypothetical protein
LLVLGLLLYAVAGAGTAIYESLLVPFRFGTTLIPVTVPLAIGSNILLPRLAGRLNDTTWAAAVPAASWVVTVVVLLGSRREGDVLVTVAPSDLKYAAYGMFFGGVIAAVWTVGFAGSRRPPR